MNKNFILCSVCKLERIVLRQICEYLYCHAVNIWLDLVTDEFDPWLHFILWNFISVFFTVFRLSAKYKCTERTDKLLCCKCSMVRENFWPITLRRSWQKVKWKVKCGFLFPYLSDCTSHLQCPSRYPWALKVTPSISLLKVGDCKYDDVRDACQ